ncbi:AsmA family protein [Pseudodesulfovibrio tunisiensis]|uniref:AsmA family protein n=1 Tax=Pseudodesulfovibrio tunisiensis TaxID=463192 RepID=UPI001FB2DB03|nr:AsmA family protein [Pseudodesulfovibrio tunisiensis]
MTRMLRRFLVFVSETVAVAVLLGAAALFFVSRYIDTQDFRTRFVSVLQDATGVPFRLDGELDISFRPWIRLHVKGLTIPDDPEFGDLPLLEVDNLLLGVRLFPLLDRDVIVNAASVEGMTVNVVRLPDGRFNWESVVASSGNGSAMNAGSGEEGGIAIRDFVIRGADVSGCTLRMRDKLEKQSYIAQGLEMKLGEFRPGERVAFTLRGSFGWDQGDVVADVNLQGSLDSGLGRKHDLISDTSLYAVVGGGFLPDKAAPGEVTANIRFDREQDKLLVDGFHLRLLGMSAHGSFRTGRLDAPFLLEGELAVNSFAPRPLLKEYVPALPLDKVRDGLNSVSGETRFRMDGKGISLEKLSFALDDARLRGSLACFDFSNPEFHFDLTAGKLDIDRYLPLFMTEEPFVWGDFHLAELAHLRAKGKAKASSVVVLGHEFDSVSASLASSRGKMQLATGPFLFNGSSARGRAMLDLDLSGAARRSPVVSMVGAVEVAADSFVWKSDSVDIHSGGKVRLELRAGKVPCVPADRSLKLLHHVALAGKAEMTNGVISVATDHARKNVAFSRAETSLDAHSLAEDSDWFGFQVNGSLNVDGQSGKYVSALQVEGPVAVRENGDFRASEVVFSGRFAGDFFPQKSDLLQAKGRISLDSTADSLQVGSLLVRGLGTEVSGSISGRELSGKQEYSGMLSVTRCQPRRLLRLAGLEPWEMADPGVLGELTVSSRFALSSDGFRFDDVNGRLDDCAVQGMVRGEGFDTPVLRFSLDAGRLDLDRYLPPEDDVRKARSRSSQAVHESAPVRLPMTFLRALRLDGTVRIAEFRLDDLWATRVSGTVRAEKGDIAVKAKGRMYGGALDVDWSGEVGEEYLHTALKLHVEDGRIEQMLKDVAGRDYIRGETDVDFDLSASGATDDDVVNSLSGTAWFRVRDGSFRFSKSDDAGQGKRTVFQKAAGDFTVQNGVFSVQKFRMDAPPLLVTTGSGFFSVADDVIALSLRNDFVAVPSVTIQLHGRLSDPQVRIPTKNILSDTVTNILTLPQKPIDFLRDLLPW